MKAENNIEEEKLTKENAPLFLVLEITKKTIKLVYVDTPDYIADRVFQDCGINVKRLNEKELQIAVSFTLDAGSVDAI